MPDDRSRGSDLCTQCGLCCSGALHNAALLDLEAGATNLDDATAKVVTAKALVRRAQSLMPEGMTLPVARALIQDTPSPESSPPERAGQMPLRLAITALSLYLDKHFKSAREGRLLSMEPVGEGHLDLEMT